MHIDQIKLLGIIGLKNAEYVSLTNEIYEKTEELKGVQTMFETMFHESIWSKLVEFNNMTVIALFNLEKKKTIEKRNELKTSLADLIEMKKMKIIEYDGLICMYNII